MAALAASLGSLGLLAAGCGGGGSTAGTTSATTTAAAGGNAATFRAYQDCLRAHGVTIVLPRRVGTPPPSGKALPPGTAGTGRRAFRGFANLTAAQRKAAEACRSKLPAGGRPLRIIPNPRGAPATGAFAKYTRCLSRHGVKFGDANQSSSAFRKAQAACKGLLPG